MVDIVGELDDGHGDFEELLSFQHDKFGTGNNSKKDSKIHEKEKDKKNYKERKDKDKKGNKNDENESLRSTPSTASRSSDYSEIDTYVRTTLDAQAESFLKYSKALVGVGAKQIYPLDWTALRSAFDNLQPQDQMALGISVRILLYCCSIFCFDQFYLNYYIIVSFLFSMIHKK